VDLVERFAAVTGDAFENADRRVDLAVEFGEQFVSGDLNLDQRPDEIVEFARVALFVFLVLIFVFVRHRTQFLPVDSARTRGPLEWGMIPKRSNAALGRTRGRIPACNTLRGHASTSSVDQLCQVRRREITRALRL
jgi:hypothetical protein